MSSSELATTGTENLVDVAHLLLELQRQRGELGPIADELLDMLRCLGAVAPGRAEINPSSE